MNSNWSSCPETLNSGQNCFFFPCYLKIRRMTLKINKTPLLCCFNKLRPSQNGRHLADDIFKHAFSFKKMHEFRLRFHWSLFLRFEIIIFQHWFRWWLGTGQPLSEPMMVSLLTHICVIRPQWVKLYALFQSHGWIQTGVTVRKHPIWPKSTIFWAV